MPKMGFEATVTTLEQGQTWPGTYLRRLHVTAEQLAQLKLRKKGSEQSYYTVWELAIGEQGSQMTSFYDFTMIGAAKKAYDHLGPQPEASAG